MCWLACWYLNTIEALARQKAALEVAQAGVCLTLSGSLPLPKNPQWNVVKPDVLVGWVHLQLSRAIGRFFPEHLWVAGAERCLAGPGLALWDTAVGQGSRRKYSNSNVHILFEGRGERKACTIQRFISWYSDGAFHSYNLSRWVYFCVVKL